MPNERKKRRGRWTYLEDFQRSASGEMIYMGAHYAFSDAAGRSRRKVLTGAWIMGGCGLLLTLTPGFLPLPEMQGHAYVLLPYLCQLFCAVSVVWAVARLSANKEPLREYVYNATAAVLPLRALMTAVFSAATLAGDGVYLLTHSTPKPGMSVLFLGMSAITLLLSLLLRHRLRESRWEKKE